MNSHRIRVALLPAQRFPWMLWAAQCLAPEVRLQAAALLPPPLQPQAQLRLAVLPAAARYAFCRVRRVAAVEDGAHRPALVLVRLPHSHLRLCLHHLRRMLRVHLRLGIPPWQRALLPELALELRVPLRPAVLRQNMPAAMAPVGPQGPHRSFCAVSIYRASIYACSGL